MPGNFQVIYGSMVGKNCWSPASTENLEHVSRNFNLCMLTEQTIHKFNQNSVFNSSIKNYSGKIFFYPFPKNN